MIVDRAGILPDDYAPGPTLAMPEDGERVCLRNRAHRKLAIQRCHPNTRDWECYCEDCLAVDEVGEVALAEIGLGTTPEQALGAYRVSAARTVAPSSRSPRKCWQQIWVPALREWVSREVEIQEEQEGAA
ncbi:MAG TPA: hypothetical protein VFS67_30715 [Polyangiaceae bacterium]|nr:hypothetical protein [Polyangiaceae bacterium]